MIIKFQTNSILSKLYKISFCVYKLSFFINTISITTVYNSLCIPQLLYANIILGNGLIININKIQILQKRIFRRYYHIIIVKYKKNRE